MSGFITRNKYFAQKYFVNFVLTALVISQLITFLKVDIAKLSLSINIEFGFTRMWAAQQ
jgi:hypothetical protein